MTKATTRFGRAMRRFSSSILGVAIIASAAVVSFPGVASAATSLVSPTRIMPLGDSLTSGFTVQGGYRNRLEDLLIDGKYDFNFVGTLTNGLPDLESMRHEGHNGYRIDQIAAGVDSWTSSWPAEDVLLMIGTNDIGQDYQLDTAPQRLSALIDQIVADLPNANVVVSSIPPLADPSLNAKVVAYNATIPGIVGAKASQGKKVSFVDGNAVLSAADLADGVHLTAGGYAKLAQAWYDGLVPLLPTRSSTPRACPCSVWSDSDVPATVRVNSTVPVELGLKFRSDVPGTIAGVRFYKGPTNTGTHVAHLWTRTGTMLAEATFTNESSSGWQEVSFASPVNIQADTTYVVSYTAPVGQNSQSDGYFNNKMAVNWPLRALAWGQSLWNGTFKWNGFGFPSDLPNGQPNYWVDVVFQTNAPAPPSAPSGLSASAVSTSRVDLSWNDVATETGFKVQRSPDGSTGWTQIGTTAQNATTFSDTGLSASTTYFYRVIATNAGGDSAPSNVASATTLTDPPDSPNGLSASAVSTSRVDLSWNDVATETGFKVQRSPDGSTGWTQIGTTAQNTTTFSDTGLSASTTYFYRVIATNAGGDSAPSNVASATTLTDPPDSPNGLSASAVSTSRVDLSWNDVATETGFKVQRSPDGSTGWTQIGTTAQNATTFSDTGLSASTTYFYRVIATNAGGDSAPSNVASARTLGDTTAPTTPTNLKATGAKRKANLSWTGSTDSGGSGLAGYEIWRSTSQNGTFTRVATIGSSTTSYSDNDVTSGLTYWYYVVAFDGAGNRSGRSSTVSAAVK